MTAATVATAANRGGATEETEEWKGANFNLHPAASTSFVPLAALPAEVAGAAQAAW